MDKVASDVAKRLRPKITHISHTSYPWLFVRADEADRALVLDQWSKVIPCFRPVTYFLLNN